MPGLKRVPVRQNDDDSDVEVASSSLRHSNGGRKRVRLTPVALDDDDEDNEPSYNTSRRRDTRTREHDDSDISDDEAIRRANRIRQRVDIDENMAAEQGIIEEIQCKNFMCHANLDMQLGPLINFIIGHNGSGKSAVLTAIQLCLGGKASSTNRGQSLKHFIKTGAEQATVTVKIKNQGGLAYQPEQYGESIIVERTFSRSGTSGFKIKRADGKIMSTKKGDLEDILDALALMMENPMNVLTQDMARQFLNSSNPGEKYKFFYQGTHLEQLDADYRLLAANNDETQTKAHLHRPVVEQAEAAYREAEKKAGLAAKVESLLDRYNYYMRQMAWIQVQEEEEKLARMEQEIRDQDAVIDQRATVAAEFDARLEALGQQRDQAREAEEAARLELTSKRGERDDVRETFIEVKKKLHESHTQQREIKQEVENAKKNVQRLEADIQKEREKIASADNGRHAEKMAEIQSGEEQLAALRQQVQEKSGESRSLDVAVHNAEEELTAATSKKSESQTGINNAQRRLRALENDHGDWKEAYSPKLPALLRLIEQERGFSQRPVGPLGRHIQLLKPIWADILEKQAGESLNGFVVTTRRDQTILSDLMKRAGYNGGVFVTSARPIDTSSNEPPREFDTWLRVLKIDNPLVRNCLIINQGADKTLLEESMSRGGELISQGIPNVAQIFCIDPKARNGERWGKRFALSSGGGETSEPIQPWKGGTRMQSDVEARIAAARDELAEARSQHQINETAHHELQTKLNRAKQAVERHKREIRQFQLDEQRQETQVQDLKYALEADTPQEQALEGLEAGLREAQEDLQMQENQYGDAVVEKDNISAEMRPIKTQLDALEREVTDLEEKATTAKSRLEKAERKREAELREVNQKHAFVEDAKEHKGRLEQDRGEQAERLDEFTHKAEEISPRVPIDEGETVDSLAAKLDRLKRERARTHDELGGDRETLTLKKLEAKAFWDQKQRELDDLNECLIMLKKALEMRRKRWDNFRRLISGRAKAHFVFLLENRGFRGELLIDHSDRLLEINVQPDAAAKSAKGRQTKTLSGGEKSFSTICLLLALWEAMGSPVRCLDEFDVFMDQVNRDVSMKMMIEAARRSASRQFVLITPQSMNNITLGSDVKIHKMSDPERGQTTLSQFVRA